MESLAKRSGMSSGGPEGRRGDCAINSGPISKQKLYQPADIVLVSVQRSAEVVSGNAKSKTLDKHSRRDKPTSAPPVPRTESSKEYTILEFAKSIAKYDLRSSQREDSSSNDAKSQPLVSRHVQSVDEPAFLPKAATQDEKRSVTLPVVKRSTRLSTVLKNMSADSIDKVASARTKATRVQSLRKVVTLYPGASEKVAYLTNHTYFTI
jgi:hypothetical protein